MGTKHDVRVGLVELWVSPGAGAPSDKFEAVKRAILGDPVARLRLVREVLEHERTQDLDALLFPGWTIAADELPGDLVEACGDRVVVLECVARGARAKGGAAASYDWTTHTVWRGRVVASARQLLSSAPELNDDVSHRLCSELTGERSPRVFTHPRLGRVALLVCGEVNVVQGVAPAALVGFDTILNPAHTPGRLEAMRKKREMLSSKGALFSTANTHEGWTVRDGTSRNAGHVAAEWFSRGRRQRRPDAEHLSDRATLRIARSASGP